MTPDQLHARLKECRKCPPPEYEAVKERWKGFTHTVRINDKWRFEGFITYLMHNFELLRSIEPSLPVIPPPHLFDPKGIARLFGIPIEELGLRGPSGKIGKPGRPATTRDVADFAHERRPYVTWKDIFAEWKRLHPLDPRDITPEKIKDAFRRVYCGKDGPKRIQ
ncbi:MAG: hypothetical protein AABP62_29575 [Planctomycetota bacterium]